MLLNILHSLETSKMEYTDGNLLNRTKKRNRAVNDRPKIRCNLSLDDGGDVWVDKDGSYSLRNDLRDHNRLVKTLAEKVGQ